MINNKSNSDNKPVVNAEKKNVLLLCISPVARAPKENEYSYITDAGTKFEDIKARMTNEAPTKAIIKMLDEAGSRLDRIVMICSETASEKVRDTITRLNDGKYICNDPVTDAHSDETNVELYKRFINEYVEDFNQEYITKPIEFIEVAISDHTEDFEVSKPVIDAANAVGDEVNLFIDFNGGQRYIAFMLVAISNLMKNRNVEIKNTLTMNFNPKGVTPIQNMKSIFNSIDLVSGINEFLNFGRIKTLENYFAPFINKEENATAREIKDILGAIKEFANNLQLCRTGYLMEHRSELLAKLDNYIENSYARNESNTYEQLFAYVVKDIKDAYKGMLDGELPDIIAWCLDKSFVQQAITFASEELPKYFWDKRIIVAERAEKAEFDLFLECLKIYRGNAKNNEKKLKKEKNDCKKRHDIERIREIEKELKESDSMLDKVKMFKEQYDDGSSKYAYAWLIDYLPNSSRKSNNKAYETVLKDIPDEKKKLAFIGPDKDDYKFRIIRFGDESKDNNDKQRNRNSNKIGLKGVINELIKGLNKDIVEQNGAESICVSDDDRIKVVNKAATLMWHIRQDGSTRRAKCQIKSESLEKVLLLYFLIKDQRNQTNHADDRADEGEQWSFDALCGVLNMFTEQLKALKDR